MAYRAHLLPSVPGNLPYQLSSYGDVLKENKWRVHNACQSLEGGVPPDVRALLFATAFQETTTLSAAQRDASKDGDPSGAANWSPWNLSEDLLRHLGFSNNESFYLLNRDDHLVTVVKLVLRGVCRWGAARYLAFVRGGRTGFADGKSYGVQEYTNGVATQLNALAADQSLFWDDRRPDVVVPQV